MLFRLAALLGRPAKELARTMDADEFLLWSVYLELEATGWPKPPRKPLDVEKAREFFQRLAAGPHLV